MNSHSFLQIKSQTFILINLFNQIDHMLPSLREKEALIDRLHFAAVVDSFIIDFELVKR